MIEFPLAPYLDLVGQEGKDLLSGRAQDVPAVVGRLWEGYGLGKALQQGVKYGGVLVEVVHT